MGRWPGCECETEGGGEGQVGVGMHVCWGSERKEKGGSDLIVMVLHGRMMCETVERYI